jgi:hypothetical protein
LKMIKIVNWNFMPDFDVGIMTNEYVPDWIIWSNEVFLGVGWDWVHLVYRPLTGLLYQPWMIDDESGAVGGMRIVRGYWSTRRKPAPMPLCTPQIPHDLSWARAQAAAVGRWQLTAWAVARPVRWSYFQT